MLQTIVVKIGADDSEGEESVAESCTDARTSVP